MRKRGSDLRYDLEISLRQAGAGLTTTLTVGHGERVGTGRPNIDRDIIGWIEIFTGAGQYKRRRHFSYARPGHAHFA